MTSDGRLTYYQGGMYVPLEDIPAPTADGQRERCWCCHSDGELHEATITDTSGGAYLQLCRWCRDLFERRHDIYQPTVCVRCSRHSDPSRADGLRFFDPGEGEALHICDDCRVDLLGMASGGEAAPRGMQ